MGVEGGDDDYVEIAVAIISRALPSDYQIRIVRVLAPLFSAVFENPSLFAPVITSDSPPLPNGLLTVSLRQASREEVDNLGSYFSHRF